jgi:ABC-type phosphate/phosphonate transport system substrate-binding protein
MRDSDLDNRSVVIARAGSEITSLRDLRGRKVAVGASDSPQATLIPLAHLARHGLRSTLEIEVIPHEVLNGLHGDHVGGERAAAEALTAGRADAACMHAWNYQAFIENGLLPPLSTVILAHTEPYDHCNMTVGPAANGVAVRMLRDLLLDMDIEDPEVRTIFELEGLTRWVPARTSGYRQLAAAIAAMTDVEGLPRGVKVTV